MDAAVSNAPASPFRRACAPRCWRCWSTRCRSRIRSISFATMSVYAQSRMSRVFVLHLTIIIGMFAMAMTHSPRAILYALIAFKTLADVGGALGRASAPSTSPASDDEATSEPLR